ncbi:MAG: hypothetical protein LBQ06_07090, partial [Frankiaceae bacterium]|nr:hypothetical protein [Frankiaceae bacterium]
PSWPAGLLGPGRRADAVAVAPAHGLALIRVDYPGAAELAARAAVTRAVRRPARGGADPPDRPAPVGF